MTIRRILAGLSCISLLTACSSIFGAKQYECDTEPCLNLNFTAGSCIDKPDSPQRQATLVVTNKSTDDTRYFLNFDGNSLGPEPGSGLPLGTLGAKAEKRHNFLSDEFTREVVISVAQVKVDQKGVKNVSEGTVHTFEAKLQLAPC